MTILPALFAASVINAQVISNLNTDSNQNISKGAEGILSTMSEGTIGEMDYANDNLIFNWTKELGLEDIEEERSAEAQESLDMAIRTAEGLDLKQLVGSLSEMQASLPCLPSPEGIDMFLLTYEGICIYSAIDNPVYMIDLCDEAIKWIRYYAFDKRNYTKAIFKRYSEWEGFLKTYFDRNGVPPELTEICLVESGCTYRAVSSAGAVGMWQIMPETGRNNGMTINRYRDDRTDPMISTEVAVKILKKNYLLTGDWTLAIASYNCGAGRITPYLKNGKTVTWESVISKLPMETQKYIPRLFALHYVWTYRDKLGLEITDTKTSSGSLT